MATLTVNGFAKRRVRSQTRSISREGIHSLQDLLDALPMVGPTASHTLAMLRSTCGHISMCISEFPAAIPICRLLDIRPRLTAYLRDRGMRRNSIRSYVNYVRILLQKAREFGWVDYPSGLTEVWQPVIKAVSTVRGGKGILN